MKRLSGFTFAFACLGAGTLLGFALDAGAHHSDSFYFIDDRSAAGGAIKIEGTLSRVRLINPHAEFFVDAVDETGETVRWAIESDSWNELRTLGWAQDTLEVGDRVEVVVSKSKFHDTAGRLRDMLVYGADETEPARLFLEYIPDASDEFGQTDAPLRVLDRAPQCPGMIEYDPGRERGEETLLCVSLDAATLEQVRGEFSGQIGIF